MKRVLILVSQRPAKPAESYNWQLLQEWLAKEVRPDASVAIAALPELVFSVGDKLAIYDPEQEFDIADFDLVVFRTVGRQLERGIAAAHYLRAKGIAFTDSYLYTEGRGKLACSVPRVTAGLKVPQTVFAAGENLAKAVRHERLKPPFILKADLGKKGRNNFLITSFADLEEKLQQAAESEVEMIAQEFIPNDGDYRILVLGGKARLAIKRRSGGDSHLTNTSQGGTAEIVPLATLPSQVVKDAVKAAGLERIEVAGVDVVIHKETGQHYFLEVNRAPQLPTGAFADHKMTAYGKMIREYVRSEAAGQKELIGRDVSIAIPEFSITDMPAKVDTGAYRSALHAEDIVVKKDAAGRDVLHFTIPTVKGSLPCTAKSFTETKVRSSNGKVQKRYVIRTQVTIGSSRFSLEVSLTNRATLRYPVLLGRKALRGRFIVDVAQTKDNLLQGEGHIL